MISKNSYDFLVDTNEPTYLFQALYNIQGFLLFYCWNPIISLEISLTVLFLNSPYLRDNSAKMHPCMVFRSLNIYDSALSWYQLLENPRRYCGHR